VEENEVWKWVEHQKTEQVALPSDDDAILVRILPAGRLAFECWGVVLNLEEIQENLVGNVVNIQNSPNLEDAHDQDW
jgi:hypothetical protein